MIQQLQGHITDAQGRKVDFKNTILILTSNLGSDLILDGIDGQGEITEEAREGVSGLLRRAFRPEFLNRIDEVVMFEPLSQTDVREILKMQIRDLQDKLSENGVSITFTQEFEDYMSTKGYEPAYGARPIKRLMQKELVNLLAKAILDGHVKRDSVITVTTQNGQIAFI